MSPSAVRSQVGIKCDVKPCQNPLTTSLCKSERKLVVIFVLFWAASDGRMIMMLYLVMLSLWLVILKAQILHIESWLSLICSSASMMWIFNDMTVIPCHVSEKVFYLKSSPYLAGLFIYVLAYNVFKPHW